MGILHRAQKRVNSQSTMKILVTQSLVLLSTIFFRESSGRSIFQKIENIMGQVLGNTVSDSRKYYEQPKFSVEQTFPGFELRKYEASTWTSANVANTGNHKQNGSNGFRMLFSYITGKTNEQKQSVSMTVPVLMQEGADDNYKMSFFLPSENSESPPVPTNPEVFTDRMQPSEFYVKSFSPKNGDYSYFEDAKKEMVGEMQAQGLKLKEDFKWIRAGYDAPFKLMNRHSEVWIPKDQVEN